MVLKLIYNRQEYWQIIWIFGLADFFSKVDLFKIILILQACYKEWLTRIADCMFKKLKSVLRKVTKSIANSSRYFPQRKRGRQSDDVVARKHKSIPLCGTKAVSSIAPFQ